MNHWLWFLPLGLVTLSACSSTPPICRPESAREAGIAQAMRGEAYNESQGGVCEEENRNIFKTNFSAGYQEGKNRYCTAASVENQGVAHGSAGGQPQFSEANYRICDSTSGLKAAYQRGYGRGVDAYCDLSKARQAGESFGEQGRAPEFEEGKVAICGGARIKKIRASYMEGHKAGLAKYCTAGNAESQGVQDGTNGADMTDLGSKYQICGGAVVARVGKAYAKGYDTGFARFCSAENIGTAAKQQAAKSPSPVFPAAYQKCLTKYPELNIQYTAVFREERRRVVETMCTYPNGVASGQRDGNSRNDKVTSMPEFCDANLFSVYLSGYLEGWKQSKDRICDTTDAYKQGVTAGLEGRPLSYGPPNLCPPEYQTALQQKYTEGFYFGGAQRTQQQQQQLLAQQGATGTQTSCRSSLDCRSGEFCRNRGDGLNLCMGHGGRSFYCISSSDCNGGLFCRSLPQNPTLRVCN